MKQQPYQIQTVNKVKCIQSIEYYVQENVYYTFHVIHSYGQKYSIDG